MDDLFHDIAYLSLLERVVQSGKPHTNRTGVCSYRLFGAQLHFDVSRSFPLLTSKKISFNNVRTELEFFLRGETNNRWLQERGCEIWTPWADPATGTLGPVYGAQWRGFSGSDWRGRPVHIDQIRRAYNLILRDPASRQIVVSAWNPVDLEDMALPPCHFAFVFSVDGHDLHLHMFQRSADIFLGVPYNIASYALLLYAMAAATNKRPGQLIISMHDVHLYENHRTAAITQLLRRPQITPSPLALAEPRAPGESAFDWMIRVPYTLYGYNPAGFLKAEVAV